MDRNVLTQKKTKLTIMEFLAKVNKSEAKRSLIPQELRYGWPAISKKNGEICVTMFYYGAQKVKDRNNYYLYPIAYSISILWRTGKIVDFKCLFYDKDFKNIEFNKPCDVFPHKGIKDMNKESYKTARTRLFELYDEFIEAIEENKDFENTQEFKKLLTQMMEPGHFPIYKAISPKFFSYYVD